MKNKEKYQDVILNIIMESGVPFAVDKCSGKVIPCETGSCLDCAFCHNKKYFNKSCESCRVMWLNEEVDNISQFRNLPVDTPILVRDSEEDDWKPRYFSQVKNDLVYVFGDGTTSFTAKSCFAAYRLDVPYKFAKLAEEKDD